MRTREMVYLALFISITFIATAVIQFRLPLPGIGGLVHTGTLVMFAIAIKYGKKYGAISGGVGMMLFDVMFGWFNWAIATLLIRLLSGFLVGLIAQDSKGQGMNIWKNILGIFVGGAVIVGGYFIFEFYFLGVEWAATGSILGNVLQIVVGLMSLALVKLLPSLETETV